MRRLRAIDWLLLLTLVPLWIAVVGLHVRELQRVGVVQAPVFVAPPADPDGYPTVAGFRLERDSSGTGLAVGDRLIRVGSRDLKGAGYFRFDALAFEEAGDTLEVPLVSERQGQRREAPLRLRPSDSPWSRLAFSLSFAAIAVLILLRAPERTAARWFTAGFLGLAIAETPFQGGPQLQTYAAYALFYTGTPAAIFCLLRWLRLFPEELADRDRCSAAWAWVALLFPLARLNYILGGPVRTDLVPQVVLFSDLAILSVCVCILTHNYAKSDPLGKRRVKWVLCGAYVAFLPLLVSLVAPSLELDFLRYDEWLDLGVLMSFVLPASFLLAILRHRLFDIDRIIGTTLTCSVLVALAVGVLATVIAPLAHAASSAVGAQSESLQAAFSALLAAAAVPVYQRMRPEVDRLLFQQRHGLEIGVRDLVSELSSCRSSEELARHLGERLDELIRPESCALYALVGDRYVPELARGQSLPPEFACGSPLLSAIEALDGVTLASDPRSGRSSDGSSQAKALATLDAAVVMPIRPRGRLAAFACLGPKCSGDIYTPTDLSHLSTVAERAAAQLQGLEHDRILERERTLQSELRKYVPGAIADRIESGGELDARERDVTVLFVDIRGYTGYAESRDATEIFSVINQYTETVSSIVREHGGSVVEFNGDGMMVVFGAPDELPEKERASVQAAGAIVAAMGSVSPTTEPLAVGVGIATGAAFVGNIRAADRMIWSAIGNTTNRAARLQSLSRDLDASIVLDDATWRAAGEATRGFALHSDVRMRGRSEREDVHTLPLGTGAAVGAPAS